MSAPRLRRPTSRGVVSPMHLVAVVIALVGGVAIVGIATLSPYSPFNMGSSQSSLSLAECSQIESSTNLTAGIVHLYYGDGNRTGPGSGLINQSLPGPSAYPPEDVAVANVEGGWNSVCTSHAFYVLEQRWGPQNASWSGLARNTTGIYEYVITITWQADSTQCTPSFGECLGSAVWLVNVASGAVSGPSTDFFSPVPPATPVPP